jgi:hypothetical protein
LHAEPLVCRGTTAGPPPLPCERRRGARNVAPPHARGAARRGRGAPMRACMHGPDGPPPLPKPQILGSGVLVRIAHLVAGAQGGRVVGLVDGGPLGERDVVRVDHHRVGHRERLAVHDHAHGRVEERHPLVGHQAHARILGHPRAAHVELVDDGLGLGLLVDLGGARLGAVEAVGHPLRHLVPRRHAVLHAGDKAALIESHNVAALPELEGVLGVEEQLVGLATVGTHHHGKVGHHRGARVVHTQHEQLRRRRGRLGCRRQGCRQREERSSRQHRDNET